MNVENKRRRTLQAWLFVGALVALAATLGALQYRWLGEVSQAEHDRLRNSLQTSLNHLSRDFDYEITSASTALLPDEVLRDDAGREREFAARYANWKSTHARGKLFSTIFLAVPKGSDIKLKKLNADGGAFQPIPWPAAWNPIRERLLSKLTGEHRFGGFVTEDYPSLIDVPFFGKPNVRPQSFREVEWLLIEVNLDYVEKEMMPELVRRHLGTDSYQVQVVSRAQTPAVIYASDKRLGDLGRNADASVAMFSLRPDFVFRRSSGLRRPMGPTREGMGPGPGPGPGMWRGARRRDENAGAEHGRWEMFARHNAGSLEVLVARTRKGNLIISSAILLLMIGAGASLLRSTRRSQRLAELQMEFVASVSHELRTPLSVMRTAGHNLQGRVSTDPERVRRYGALIEDESEKLTGMVEQVLRFSNAKLGRVIGAKEEVSIDSVIDSAIHSDRRVLQDSHCELEKHIPDDLPQVLGDATTLKHAFQNILSNAAKYGSSGGWIGIFVSATGGPDAPAIQVRIADRGEGIPADEVAHIFDPFYRGKKALSDQIHGTGLGLSLTKRIIEAHGGTIAVQSQAGQGTEFVIRIPAVAASQTHEFAHSTD